MASTLCLRPIAACRPAVDCLSILSGRNIRLTVLVRLTREGLVQSVELLCTRTPDCHQVLQPCSFELHSTRSRRIDNNTESGNHSSVRSPTNIQIHHRQDSSQLTHRPSFGLNSPELSPVEDSPTSGERHSDSEAEDNANPSRDRSLISRASVPSGRRGRLCVGRH